MTGATATGSTASGSSHGSTHRLDGHRLDGDRRRGLAHHRGHVLGHGGRRCGRRLGNDGSSGCVRVLDLAVERLATGDDEPRLAVERAAHVLDHEVVRRIGDRDDRQALLKADGKNGVQARLLDRQQLHRRGIDRGRVELHELQALLASEQPAEVVLGDEPALEQHLAEALATLHAVLERLLELLLGEQALAKDQRAERHVPHVGDRDRRCLRLHRKRDRGLSRRLDRSGRRERQWGEGLRRRRRRLAEIEISELRSRHVFLSLKPLWADRIGIGGPVGRAVTRIEGCPR